MRLPFFSIYKGKQSTTFQKLALLGHFMIPFQKLALFLTSEQQTLQQESHRFQL